MVRRVWPVGLGVLLGVLALGPALAPGFVLAYDMVFVPEPALSATSFGLTGTLPRAVPSDALVTALTAVLPGDLVQKLVLLGIFALACSGAAALLEREAAPVRLAAAVFYTWNPFVAERLLIGQWALLLGYAGLPWAVRAALAARERRLRRAWVAAFLPAAAGGFMAMILTALTVLSVAALSAQPGRVRALRRTAVACVVLSLPWLVPSLLRGPGVPGDGAGVAAFAARADSPLGPYSSLMSLSGIWNAEVVPGGYDAPLPAVLHLLVAVAAVAAFALTRGLPGRRGLAVAACAGFAVAALGITEPGRAALRGLIGLWPGFAVLRDAQQYVAPLVLLQALGVAALARALTGAPSPGEVAGAPSPGEVAGAPSPGEVAGPRSPGEVTGAPSPGEITGAPSSGEVAGPRSPGGITGPRSSGEVAGAPSPREIAGAARRGFAARPASRGRAAAERAVITAVVAAAPLLLLPGLAFGGWGRLGTVEYPRDFERVRALVAADTVPGDVLLLPWESYRAYDWNGRRPSLDPLPRYLPRRVVWNDAVRVGGVVVGAEDPRARALDGLLRSGAELAGPLRAAGFRFVVLDGDASEWNAFQSRLAGARQGYAGPHAALYVIDNPAEQHEGTVPVPVAWLTWFVAVSYICFHLIASRSNVGAHEPRAEPRSQ
ncbi:hypothetical protein [Sphaerisporangium sp. TRM90804]|uniref:hypothetical protein n=1 Tax=Sphaerisporangium sp. TRM90804 TaxID=3031113 RepID=UPI0024482C17|nr:hypothetical protein [Sphaerisporangium sp. TRM90804]MDH2427901.1 hypothetical protein [Sphaerisporangium sp. TRM90804]